MIHHSNSVLFVCLGVSSLPSSLGGRAKPSKLDEMKASHGNQKTSDSLTIISP